MKKLLLGFGAVASVIAPIAAVVACGDDAEKVQTISITSTTKNAAALKTAAVKQLDSFTFGKDDAPNIQMAAIIKNLQGVQTEFGITFKLAKLNEKLGLTTNRLTLQSKLTSFTTNVAGTTITMTVISKNAVTTGTKHTGAITKTFIVNITPKTKP